MSGDIHGEALEGFEKTRDYWSRIYDAGRDDLVFLSDRDGAQWDAAAFERRRKRNKPALQIDRLTQFINRISNDVRMNTPSIDVVPHSGAADVETAEIYQGLIRDIERNSNADDAYDYAVNSAIRGSIGFLRVDHRYRSDDGFEQEFFIERIVNPFSVFLDPASVTPDGSDAMRCWVIHDLTKEEFERRYPGRNPVSFGGESGGSGEAEETVAVAEYFRVDLLPEKIALLPDGSVVAYREGLEGVVDVREVQSKSVRRCYMSGAETLEDGTFPGDYIPIVPVYGEEAWIDGERNLYSIFRKAKDAQRRYNYWASVEAEMLMKSPKSTIIAVGGTTENYAEDYKDPDNAIVLRYDQTDIRGNPAPPPVINPGPQIPAGIVNAMMSAAEDIKATLGLYDAFLGNRSNETSGVAIRQRKMEGDRAVFHYGDNLVRSITHVGRILVAGLAEINSGPMIVNIIGKEEETKQVGINGALAEGQERTFWLADGKYNVKVTTGASYATMRQEAAEFFQQVIQSQPELLSLAGDLMFKYMDFPGAQALSERVRKTIPPHLLDDDGGDPQVMALTVEIEKMKQAMAAMQAESEQARQALENKNGEMLIKTAEMQSRERIEGEKIELERRKALMDYELKRADLALKATEMEMREMAGMEMPGSAAFPENMPQSGG